MSDYLPPYEEETPTHHKTIAFAKEHTIVEPEKQALQKQPPDVVIEVIPKPPWYQNKAWQQYAPTSRKSIVMILIGMGAMGLLVGITCFLIVFFSMPEVSHRSNEELYYDRVREEQEEYTKRYYDHHYFK